MAFHFFLLRRIKILAVCLLLTACSTVSPTRQAEPTSDIPTEAVALTAEAPHVTNTTDQSQISTEVPISQPTPGEITSSPAPTKVILPSVLPPAGPTLAFLKDGDIWFLDEPSGQPYPLTVIGDIKSFAWAPDGERLAAFNGKTICFVHRDGSVRTACLDLGLNEAQAKIVRQIALSPDQRWIVLWNATNPEEEGTIGWMIVALDTTNIMYRIEDPADWGAVLLPENEPGGFTGQPLFLSDGKLIGTLTHRSLCASDGCHYQLFEFDLNTHTFSPFPDKADEGFSEGMHLLLSSDQKSITNFGAFSSDCDNYDTSVDIFNLDAQTRQTFNLEQEALQDMSLFNDLSRAVIARRSGCSQPDQQSWAAVCGLIQGYDIFPIHIWTFSTNERIELAPGVMPAISPDNKWIAFRSCLATDSSGEWNPSEETAPEIYLYNIATEEITRIESGTMPQWQSGP